MGRSLSGKRFLAIWASLTIGTAIWIAGPAVGASRLQSSDSAQVQSPTSPSGTTVTGSQTQTTASPTEAGQIGGPPSQRSMPTAGEQTAGSTRQSVPGAAKISPARATLNLPEAIDLAIRNNLATLLAHERRSEAQGIEKELRAGLLPNIFGAAYQANLVSRQTPNGSLWGPGSGYCSFDDQ